MIVQKPDGWYVLSESTGKNLGGPFGTRAEAEHRLAQVEYFKNRASSDDGPPAAFKPRPVKKAKAVSAAKAKASPTAASAKGRPALKPPVAKAIGAKAKAKPKTRA